MVGVCRIWIPKFGLMAKPLYEITKTQIRNHYFGMKNRKSLLMISTRMSPEPLVMVTPVWKIIHLVCSWKARHSSRVLMQKLDKFLSLLGIFPKTRFHGPRLAWLLPGGSCHHFISGRSSQAYFWTATGSPDPSSRVRASKIKYHNWLTEGRLTNITLCPFTPKS